MTPGKHVMFRQIFPHFAPHWKGFFAHDFHGKFENSLHGKSSRICEVEFFPGNCAERTDHIEDRRRCEFSRKNLLVFLSQKNQWKSGTYLLLLKISSMSVLFILEAIIAANLS